MKSSVKSGTKLLLDAALLALEVEHPAATVAISKDNSIERRSDECVGRTCDGVAQCASALVLRTLYYARIFIKQEVRVISGLGH